MALDLASITGWQRDRRRALALLSEQGKRAEARFDARRASALYAARWDVLNALRGLAEAEIAESIGMPYLHHQWPRQVAA